jgi:hypothetical protein
MAVQDITSIPINNQAIAMRMFLEAKADEEARKAAEKAGIVRTEIAPLGPGEEVEYEAPGVVGDPGSWLNRGLGNLADAGATALLGEGTGNTTADILLGLTGPGAAIGTAATGNRPGVLDMLPGGGALKGMAVFAVPKATRVIRGVLGKSLKGDYAVDAAYRIAQEAVDEVSRYGREISSDDLKRAISERVDALGDVKGKVEISRYANDLADRTWARAMEGMEQGKPFNLKVPEEHTMLVSNVSMDKDAVMPSLTPESQKIYRDRSKDKYDELFSRLSTEEQGVLNKAAHDYGEEERAKALADGKSRIKANHIAEKSRRKFTHAFLRDKFPETPKSSGEIKPAEYELPENVASAAKEARRKVFDESIKSGLSEDQARKAGNVAYHRVVSEMTKTDPSFKKVMQGKKDIYNNNMRVVISKIDPEVMREIDEEASLARAAKKKSSLEHGASLTKATSDGQSAYTSLRQHRVNEFIKSLGFKSFSDTRMNQYSQLRRDGNHVLATPTERTLMSPGTEQAAAYPVTPTERTLMAADPSQVNYSTSPAAGDALEDIADDEIDASIADGWFNKEYLEKLRQEWGL